MLKDQFKAVLADVLDTKAYSVIDRTVEELIFAKVDTLDAQQRQILEQIYSMRLLDSRWLIAAFHLGEEEKERGLREWILRKHGVAKLPDLDVKYVFD